MEESSDDPRTELDSYANMVFMGSNSFLFESTGKTCNAQLLTSDLLIVNNVPIVDGELARDCSCTGEFYVLVIRNALHVPSMEHNLMPPLTMRAGSFIIKDIPKSHYEDPEVDDHSGSFEHSNPRIPLQLNGVF